MSHKDEIKSLVTGSKYYQEFLAERDEILKHKWIESQKAGYDIGFGKALIEWVSKYRTNWKKDRK
jgi:hypothetical protein